MSKEICKYCNEKPCSCTDKPQDKYIQKPNLIKKTFGNYYIKKGVR